MFDVPAAIRRIQEYTGGDRRGVDLGATLRQTKHEQEAAFIQAERKIGSSSRLTSQEVQHGLDLLDRLRPVLANKRQVIENRSRNQRPSLPFRRPDLTGSTVPGAIPA